MTAKELNRANIAAFLTSCIGRAWAMAIDAEHGLRIQNVKTFDDGRMQIELDRGHAIDIAFAHSVPRRVPAPAQGTTADASH